MRPYYQDDWATIYHGDCLELLPQMPKVDLVLTDPPYGKTDQMYKKGFGSGSNWERSTDFKWDKRPTVEHFELILQSANIAIIWGGNYFCNLLSPSNCWLVWYKQNGNNPFGDAELAWTNMNKSIKLKEKQWIGGAISEARWHPTQKPLEVILWAIEQAPNDSETILDPFLGSGTTLVAAKQLNRQSIGIEIEEKYCEIGAKRLSQEVLDFRECA